MIVCKFGGTSVQDAESIARTADIIGGRLTRQPVVVVSALGGVTNEMLDVGNRAATGNLLVALSVVEAFRERHLRTVAALLDGSPEREEVEADVSAGLDELAHLAEALSTLGFVTPRSLDTVAAIGELLSSRIVAAAFRHRGIPADWVDARDVLITDEHFTRAVPDTARIAAAAREHVRPVAQAGSLGAEDQRHRAARHLRQRLANRRLARTVEPEEHVAHVRQRLHRVGEVLHPQVGLPFERARRGLGERTGLGGGMPRGRDDGARSEHLGRAQDGAHVVRVRHAVQQHQRAALGRDVLHPPPVERPHLERRALVDRTRVERRGKAARIGDLWGEVPRRDRLGPQPVRRVLRQDQPEPRAPRVQERVAHRVEAEEPHGLGRRGPPRPLLVDHPGGLLRTLRGHAPPLALPALDAPEPARGQARAVRGAPARARGFSC